MALADIILFFAIKVYRTEIFIYFWKGNLPIGFSALIQTLNFVSNAKFVSSYDSYVQLE